MWKDRLQLNQGIGYWKLFWEIYRQEVSNKDCDKIKVQVRKETLAREAAVDMVQGPEVRERILDQITYLESSSEEKRLGLDWLKKQRGREIGGFQGKIDEKDLMDLAALKAQWTLSNKELVQWEKKRIRQAPRMTNQEYLEASAKSYKARIDKWSATSFRGIGASMGVLIGGVAGFILMPGVGATLGIGILIGSGVGGILGTIILGNLVNAIIVGQLIPLKKAFGQAGKVGKLRKKRYRSNGKGLGSLTPIETGGTNGVPVHLDTRPLLKGSPAKRVVGYPFLVVRVAKGKLVKVKWVSSEGHQGRIHQESAFENGVKYARLKENEGYLVTITRDSSCYGEAVRLVERLTNNEEIHIDLLSHELREILFKPKESIERKIRQHNTVPRDFGSFVHVQHPSNSVGNGDGRQKSPVRPLKNNARQVMTP